MIGPQGLQALPDGLRKHLQVGVEPVVHLLGQAEADLNVVVDPLQAGASVGDVLKDVLQRLAQLAFGPLQGQGERGGLVQGRGLFLEHV